MGRFAPSAALLSVTSVAVAALLTAGSTGTAGTLRPADASAGSGLRDMAMPGSPVLASIANAQSIAQRNAIAAQGGPGGTWHRYGNAPVLNNTSDYAPVDAIPTFTGRVSDFASDPATGRIWTAVGLGGLYETRDLGAHWRALTDSLPNTSAGAVGFSTSHGGTLFDATGDFDGGFLGLGVWRSTDDGAHWQRSQGIPDGLMSTRVAVDPTDPDVVFVATSRGLFRSGDDGATFSNVALPVGTTYMDGSGPNCAGDMTHAECALASVVTDVVVRPAGGGDNGGEVLAAVGWERGVHHTSKGWYNALGNGLYASATGLPGSFANTDASSNGFTPQSHIGRVSLGNAVGAGQNHAVIWAMVQDSQTENGNFPVVDPQPGVPEGLCATAPCYNTELDNLYESTDFGKTWNKKLPPAQTLGVSCPVTSTDQCLLLTTPVPVVGAGYGPGIQARYNNYVRIDPTSTTADGTPTRLIFGLEELWEVNLEDSANQQALTDPTALVVPKTIGRYFGNGFCPTASGLTAGPVNTNSPCPYENDAPTTTHPDQHRGVWIPDGQGGVTFFAGNDGGVFSQHVGTGQDFSNTGWAVGDNRDMNTMLSYDMAASADGVVYTGLQDNGEVRIEPNGREVEVFGGDAFYSATDPNDSNTVYEEYTFGNMSVSTDGGHTWTGINPGLTAPLFSTPFAMDPSDANHLVIGGEDIQETVSGPKTTVATIAPGDPSTTSSTDWALVFDTGSGNAVSAIDTRGDATYAGFCGPCYIASTVAADFSSGIATNMGGAQPGQKMTSNGWHVATAYGLPERYITSVRVDPTDHNTVYVTLADYEPDVEYRQPGYLGDGAKDLGKGHVYKSTDAGEHFTDISGNLPDAPADDVIVRGNQLIASTNTGVYVSSDLDGGQWHILGGTSMPLLHMTTIQLQPGNPNRLFAATYGKGILVYDFPSGTQLPTTSSTTATHSGVSGVTSLPNTAAAPVSQGGAAAAAGMALLGVWVRRRSRRTRRAG